MIASHELRLGNWVASSKESGSANIQITSIDAAASNYAPIAITPEILRKCGFTFHTYFKLWQKEKPFSGTGPDMELDQDYWVVDFTHHRIGVSLTSLHQLQNLYFSLKGKELQIEA